MLNSAYARKGLGTIATALLMLSIASAPARAATVTVIDFDNLTKDGGSVTPIGGGHYAGTDIIFDSIFLRSIDTVTGTVITNFAGVQCGTASSTTEVCFLDFNTATGAFVVDAQEGLYDIGPDFLPYTGDTGLQVAADGSIVLTGTIGAYSVLSPLGPFNVFSATGNDTKNQQMLNFFGVSATTFSFANTEIYFKAGGGVAEADLINSIPEPGTLGLFGLGLVGLGRAVRRRQDASSN